MPQARRRQVSAAVNVQEPQPSSKSRGRTEAEPADAPPEHIWLAGLGALAQAKNSGQAAFDALVKEGSRLSELQTQWRKLAQQQWQAQWQQWPNPLAALQQVWPHAQSPSAPTSDQTQTHKPTPSDASPQSAEPSPAGPGPAFHFEGIFESRVQRALERLMWPGRAEWVALLDRVTALEAQQQKPAKRGTAPRNETAHQLTKKPTVKPTAKATKKAAVVSSRPSRAASVSGARAGARRRSVVKARS